MAQEPPGSASRGSSTGVTEQDQQLALKGLFPTATLVSTPSTSWHRVV